MGMISAQKYRALCKSIGISRSDIARIFHVHPRTVQRWASLGAPHGAALTLRIINAQKLTPEEIYQFVEPEQESLRNADESFAAEFNSSAKRQPSRK